MKSSCSYLDSWLRHDVCTPARDGSNRYDSFLRDDAYHERFELPPECKSANYRRMGDYTTGVYISYMFSYRAKKAKRAKLSNVLDIGQYRL